MTYAEVAALNLKPGDSIRVRVRTRQEPYCGQFLKLYIGLLLWKSNGGEQGKALSDILEIDKVSVMK